MSKKEHRFYDKGYGCDIAYFSEDPVEVAEELFQDIWVDDDIIPGNPTIEEYLDGHNYGATRYARVMWLRYVDMYLEDGEIDEWDIGESYATEYYDMQEQCWCYKEEWDEGRWE